ncbi:MAG: hypothetical protein WA294_05025, partial [Acidobacteriaceae bacterium]
MRIASHLVIWILMCWLIAPCISKAQSPAAQKRVVDVRCNGDDGLTSRLCEAIQRALRAQPDLVMEDATHHETLIVQIPTNVSWKSDGQGMQVFSAVKFLNPNGETLKSSRVSCHNPGLSHCAT